MYEELKYWYLKDHKLFRTLSMAQIKQLCIITGFKKGNKRDVIYFSSSDVPRIFFLKKGNIKIVSIDEDGNESVKDIIDAYIQARMKSFNEFMIYCQKMMEIQNQSSEAAIEFTRTITATPH
jgi:CRP-like cAMP-binding protein